MNFGALKARALRQAGLDEAEAGGLMDELGQYLNEGYSRLALERYRPWQEERLTARDGSVPYQRMAKRPLALLTVSSGARGLLSDKAVLISGVADGDSVTLRYTYAPRELTEDEDTPKLPAWCHGAIADFATWRLLMTGGGARQQRSHAFRLAFEEAYARLEPCEGVRRRRMIGLYEEGGA